MQDFGGDMSDYDYFDRLRASLVDQRLDGGPFWKVRRSNQSSIVHVTKVEQTPQSAPRDEQSPPTRNNNTATTYRLMHLAGTFGFSRGTSAIQYPSLDRAKAVLLAQHHFNQRSEAVVPNLRQLLQSPKDDEPCNVRLTVDFYDTGRNPRVGVGVLTQHIHPRPFPYETSAVVGVYRSAVSVPMAVLNSARHLPQISHASTSNKLSDRGSFSSFGRVVPSNDADARAALQYFQTVLGTTHLGIVYVNDEYGSAYRIAMERYAAQARVVTQSVGLVWDLDLTDSLRQSVARAVEVLEQTGFRHFFAIVFVQHVQMLVDMGAHIMGPEYIWVFGDGVPITLVESWKFPARSPQAIALAGIATLTLGESELQGSVRQFHDAFRQQNRDPEFWEYFVTRSPRATSKVKFQPNLTRSRTAKPSTFSDFAYDAVMALGIAACHCESDFFTGSELFAKFVQANFTGATGDVQIDPATGGRRLSTVSRVMRQAQMVPVVRDDDDDDEDLVSVKFAIVAEYRHIQTDISNIDDEALATTPTSWSIISSGSNASRVGVAVSFRTITPSLPPREIGDIIHPTTLWVFSICAVFLMLTSLGFAVWTWWFRNENVVRVSQPLFLFVICLGEFFMACAVITAGATSPTFSQGFANASCMATAWFVGVGFSLVFSALFAKMWRIYKIFTHGKSFRRVKVTVGDVALPGVVLVLGNVLITAAWQVVDPLRYEPVFDEWGTIDRFGRPLDVSTVCSSQRGLEGYFFGASAILMTIAVIAANVQGYRTRRFNSEYSESAYIEYSMAIILQAMVLGLPVLLFDADPQSAFVARSSLILLIASTTQFLIFVPKVRAYISHERARRERARQRVFRLAAARAALEALSRRSNSSCPGRSRTPGLRHSAPDVLRTIQNNLAEELQENSGLDDESYQQGKSQNRRPDPIAHGVSCPHLLVNVPDRTVAAVPDNIPTHVSLTSKEIVETNEEGDEETWIAFETPHVGPLFIADPVTLTSPSRLGAEHEFGVESNSSLKYLSWVNSTPEDELENELEEGYKSMSFFSVEQSVDFSTDSTSERATEEENSTPDTLHHSGCGRDHKIPP